jgi:hypothetical protein
LAYGIKAARVLVTLLLVILVTRRNNERISKYSGSLLLFAFVFTLSAVWSDYPVKCLINKLMFFFACAAGVYTMHAAKSVNQLNAGMRMLGWTAILVASLTFGLYLRNPVDAMVLNRLALAEMIANNLGQGTAVFLILLTLFFINAQRTSEQFCAALGILLLTWMIVSSGSSGSAILAVGGVAAIILPNVSRPSVVTLLLAVIPFGLFLFATLISDGDQDIGLGAWRFTGEELREDTHIDYWRQYLQIRREAEASLFYGKRAGATSGDAPPLQLVPTYNCSWRWVC